MYIFHSFKSYIHFGEKIAHNNRKYFIRVLLASEETNDVKKKFYVQNPVNFIYQEQLRSEVS